jgi:hypothetical protein
MGTELYDVILEQGETAEAGERIPGRMGEQEAKLPTIPGRMGEQEAKLPTIPDAPEMFSTPQQKKEAFIAAHGKAPVLTGRSIAAKPMFYDSGRVPEQVGRSPQRETKVPVKPLFFDTQTSFSRRSNFSEQARLYANERRDECPYVPFQCYWPSYEFMSRPQLDYYFYLRGFFRSEAYIAADLSYLFLYIYELINQAGADGTEDGIRKLAYIWANYRKPYKKLDLYMIPWVGDYLEYYSCDMEKAYGLLEQAGLFLLLSADMQFDFYAQNDRVMPVELIARFSDYKFYNSVFVRGENGSLLLEYLPGLIYRLREPLMDHAPPASQSPGRIPFSRALFDDSGCMGEQEAKLPTSPGNKYLPVRPAYEKHIPFRAFITAAIKTFENELRALTKYKGRLGVNSLPAECINICKRHALDAYDGIQTAGPVEITINRERLLALIKDSDEVRERLLDGQDEYGGEESGTSTPQTFFKKEIIETQPTVSSGMPLLSLTPLQQKIIAFLRESGGDSSSDELNSAFPGVFVGVEIDYINAAALDATGDLLIFLENDRWNI